MDVLVLHARPYKRKGIPGILAPILAPILALKMMSTAGDYLFFDPEHPHLNGRIKVNDNSDATRNVKM